MTKGWILLVTLELIVLMIASSGEAAGQRSKRGDKCQWKDGVGEKMGRCVKLVNCSAGISNYKAGTPLQQCQGKVDGKTTYCCPVEKRISEIKCEEYTRQRLKLSREALRVTQTRGKGQGKVRKGRIVAGRNAVPDEFPFMVALTVGDPKDKQWPCGGTIISDRFVLTAAHCVIMRTGRLRIKPLKVLVGDVYLKHNQRRPYPYVTVKDVFVHPGYNHTSVYDDIALLELDVALNITKSQGPACLPSPFKRFDLDTTFQATGWGYLKYNGRRPNNLQVATVPRMNHTTCVKVFSDDKKLSRGISRTQFCAGHQDGDTCTGDSGGPLIATRVERKATKYYIVGVTSYGTVLCGSKPGLYINVQSYLNWIENIVWNTDGGLLLSSRNNLYIREY